MRWAAPVYIVEQWDGREPVPSDDPGTPAGHREGLDVPPQETLERLVRSEDGVARGRVAEHKDKRRERPRCARAVRVQAKRPSPLHVVDTVGHVSVGVFPNGRDLEI